MTELFVETSAIGPGHVDGEGAVANCQLAEAKDGTTLSGGVPGEGASHDGRLNVLAYPGGAVLRGRILREVAVDDRKNTVENTPDAAARTLVSREGAVANPQTSAHPITSSTA
jgi:hypothetical protein